ncbi:MAG: LicD family protein [Solobacterium sp.]|jgi:lipopolysaccharide cholinephosphotransferase|nr:LicD family protein [Solobacterium sp.]
MTDNKKVQDLTLNTLNVLINFCEMHNLRYYFTGGALIGVLRHKGFIPWDDDIDLGFPRKDFDKLHELLKKEMPEGYGICNRYTDPNWHFAMSQFIDLESEIEINLAEQPRKAHIWIDIFPIDGLPNNRIFRYIRVKRILLKRYIVQIANISTQIDSHRNRPHYEKIIIKICQIIPIGKLFNTEKVLNSMEKLLRKSDFDKVEWCGNMLGRYREKEVVKKKWFGNPRKGQFENEEVNIPENSDAILKHLYGEYMEFPPEKDRIAHGVKVIKCRNL